MEHVRARMSPTLSNSFSYLLQTLVHLRYSFTTTPRLLQSLSHLFPFSYFHLSSLSFPYLHCFPFRLSPISADPYLFPDSHERSLVIAPLLRFLLISSPIAAVPTLAAQLAYRGNPLLRFSHACSTFPTDRENSLTLAPLFVTFHCGHALLFSVHGHASKQCIRRAPCTVVSSDSI